MARGQRKSSGVPRKRITIDKMPNAISDEEENSVDPDSRENIYDFVDDFHLNQEKITLDGRWRKAKAAKNEVEVLSLNRGNKKGISRSVELQSSDEDADELSKFLEKDDISDSDIEGLDNTDVELLDSKAWGSKKKFYHGTDYMGDNYGGFRDADEEDAAGLEEQEAMEAQRRLAEEMEETDFSLEFFLKAPYVESVKQGNQQCERLSLDLTKMSKKDRLELFLRDSAEFSHIVADCRALLQELKDRLNPIMNLFHEEKLPLSSGIDFVRLKFQVILNYCTNVGFYLFMKSKNVSIENHPVIKRMIQYKKLMQNMETAGDIVNIEIDRLLKTIESSQQHSVDEFFQHLANKSIEHNRSSHKKTKKHSNIPTPKDTLSDINTVQARLIGLAANDEDNQYYDKDVENTEEMDGDKRAISYEIAKNKGLTPHRKKELRNPRVKHKMKYQKAKVRRRGQVREAKPELQKYGGEFSGIKAGLVKSRKLK